MQYRLLASDLDNTLIPFGEEALRPAVLQALSELRAKGGLFAVSTGRSYTSMDAKLKGRVPYNYAICCNGAVVTDAKGTVLYEQPMTPEEMYALVDFCEDYNYAVQFSFRDNYYAYTEYEMLKALYERMPSGMLSVVDGEDQDRHLIDMPHAAFVILPRDAVDRFQEQYGHLNLKFMQVGGEREGGWYSYDVCRTEIDKAGGLAWLCGALGFGLEQAVAAGDGENDCGMLRAAGLGCAMANGCDAAKLAAGRVIGDVREDGLAALIGEVWLGGPVAEPSGRALGPAAAL